MTVLCKFRNFVVISDRCSYLIWLQKMVSEHVQNQVMAPFVNISIVKIIKRFFDGF